MYSYLNYLVWGKRGFAFFETVLMRLLKWISRFFFVGRRKDWELRIGRRAKGDDGVLVCNFVRIGDRSAQ